MEKCCICGKEFKRITAKHIKTHGFTWDEYIQKYKPEDYNAKRILNFINEFYVTVRYRYWMYSKNRGSSTLTVGENTKAPLTDSTIKDHLNGAYALGVYFPQGFTRLIGLDIDFKDDLGGAKEALERVYNAVTSYVEPENVLMSFSGKKGYHVDIFLSSWIPKETADCFYQVILSDIGYNKEQVELRGGTDARPYKLPLGIHAETGCRCYVVNQYAKEMDTIKTIESVKKADIRRIYEAVDINYDYEENLLSDEEIIEFEELDNEVRYLDIYSNTNEGRAKTAERLFLNGIHEAGVRHDSMLLIALWLKSRSYCMREVKEQLIKWKDRCTNYKTPDREFLKEINSMVKTIFEKDYKFEVQARRIVISQPDIKEIFSIKTNNKLKTKALIKLYYILLIHSRAYADDEGIFYMTYEQMNQVGAVAVRVKVKTQLKELESMGKLVFVREGEINEDAKFGYKPNMYRLPVFNDRVKYPDYEQKTFKVCHDMDCKDCHEKALCYLVNDRERSKHIKGKEYKVLNKCPYNS